MFRVFSLLLLLAGTSWAGLNKTYPTSPVTTLRLEAYQDGFRTVYLSTYSIGPSWTYFGSTMTYVAGEGQVNGYVVISGSTQPANWSIYDYSNMLIEQTKLQFINEILDDAIEQYMVWPGTSPVPGWKGWCLGTVNGKQIAVACP